MVGRGWTLMRTHLPIPRCSCVYVSSTCRVFPASGGGRGHWPQRCILGLLGPSRVSTYNEATLSKLTKSERDSISCHPGVLMLELLACICRPFHPCCCCCCCLPINSFSRKLLVHLGKSGLFLRPWYLDSTPTNPCTFALNASLSLFKLLSTIVQQCAWAKSKARRMNNEHSFVIGSVNF